MAVTALAAPTLLAQGRGGAPGPQQTTGSALLVGQVVDAITGQPIADAVVALGGRGAPPPPAGVIGPPTSGPTVITGADGRFLFRDLPAGRYPVTATAAGYLSGQLGQARPSGPGRPVTLADGQRLGNLKLRLWQHGVITGRILDEAGEPVIGATVRAVRRTMAGDTPRYQSGTVARTDDRGVYRFATLAPGDYLVSVPQTTATMPAQVLERVADVAQGIGGPPLELMELMASGGTSVLAAMNGARVGDLLWGSTYSGAPVPGAQGPIETYQTLFYPNTTSLAEAAPVRVTSGEERANVDLQLRLVRSARVSGTVIGPDGPAANVAVRLVPLVDNGVEMPPEFETAAAGARRDGTFTFLGVPPGRYVATVSKRGGMDSMVQALAKATGAAPPKPSSSLYGETMVSVGGADVTGVSVVLGELPTISGTVEFDGTSPKPDLAATGGRGAAVRLTPVSGTIISMPGPSPAAGQIDQAGRFTLREYPPGRYRIEPPGAFGGRGSWMPAAALHEGRDLLVEPFDLRQSDITGVVIKYTDQAARVDGAVTMNGVAARTATVVLVPGDVQAWIRQGMPPSRARLMAAGETGRFTASSLLPGEYLIAAVDDQDAGELQDAEFIRALARVARRVTLAAGANTQNLEVVKVPR